MPIEKFFLPDCLVPANPRSVAHLSPRWRSAEQYALIDVEVNPLIEMADYASGTNTQPGLELIDRALAQRRTDRSVRASEIAHEMLMLGYLDQRLEQ